MVIGIVHVCLTILFLRLHSCFQLYTFSPRDTGNHVLNDDGKWVFDEKSNLTINVYGEELNNNMTVYVSQSLDCEDRDPLDIVKNGTSTTILEVTGKLPSSEQESDYFICIIDKENSPERQIEYLPFQLKSLGLQIPLAARIFFACFLLILSGLFSGLNLGLMSLDLTSLRILKETGKEDEQRYARQIEPVRRQGNFLLCTLLLGNVLVNSTLTILLDTLFGGLIAVIGSTAGIVIMGEIVPQAICQRFGLVVGAKTLFITKIFMVLTGPLSWPISKILDLILGEELGTFYRREQLKELIMLTQAHSKDDPLKLHKEEVDMITGVLNINEKCVKEIMTCIDDVFMLNVDTKINFEIMQEIMDRGFSRIPVYEESKNNIVGLLFVKDLAFVDPDDELPVETMVKFHKHMVHRVLAENKVLAQLNDFIKERYHMAIVKDIENPGDGDPGYVTVGVVTLEDIIEEIIQQEIVDETDAYVANDSKKKNEKKVTGIPTFARNKPEHIKISPQLLLATFTYLTTQIPEFGEEHISSNVLNKLLRQAQVVKEIKPGDKPIVEEGKPCDFMVMILTGEVKVQVGQESMVFIQGPFSTFCVPALRSVYMPDITVFPGEQVSQYLHVHREDYRRALETSEAKNRSNSEKRRSLRSIRSYNSDNSRSDKPRQTETTSPKSTQTNITALSTIPSPLLDENDTVYQNPEAELDVDKQTTKVIEGQDNAEFGRNPLHIRDVSSDASQRDAKSPNMLRPVSPPPRTTRSDTTNSGNAANSIDSINIDMPEETDTDKLLV